VHVGPNAAAEVKGINVQNTGRDVASAFMRTASCTLITSCRKTERRP